MPVLNWGGGGGGGGFWGVCELLKNNGVRNDLLRLMLARERWYSRQAVGNRIASGQRTMALGFAKELRKLTEFRKGLDLFL